MIRAAEHADIPAVLAVWAHARSAAAGSRPRSSAPAALRAHGARRATAIVGAGEEEAEGLWAAAGYTLDTTVNRFVRNL